MAKRGRNGGSPPAAVQKVDDLGSVPAVVTLGSAPAAPTPVEDAVQVTESMTGIDAAHAVAAQADALARTVTLPPAPAHTVHRAGFLALLGSRSDAAAREGRTADHGLLFELEVLAGALITKAVAAESRLEGEDADVVRDLRRIL